MRGITEERLRHVMKMHDMDDSKTSLIFSHLCNECTELNAWQPIDENTPKDKLIFLFYPGVGKQIGILIADTCCCHIGKHLSQCKPTHWQELPKDPTK